MHARCRYMPLPEVPAQEPGTPLQTKNLFKHVQVRPCLASTLIADLPLLVQRKPNYEAAFWLNQCSGVQGMLTSQSAVITETGDAWFNGQKLKLPEGCM